LWVGDELHGFCRLDPDVDTAGIHSINTNTCVGFVNAVQFKPGEAAFDPATNNIYTTDIQAGSVGVFRMHYQPAGDSGRGLVDPINIEVLVGSGTNTRQDPGGCPMPVNPFDGGHQPQVPNSAVMGPDNNLWVGFKLNGAIVRVNNPSQPVPTTTAGCDTFVQVVGTSPDDRKNFGMGWINHDLYGGDGFSTWVMHNADTSCLSPSTGNVACTKAIPSAPAPQNILSTQTPAPFVTTTDQLYPALNGNNLYVANASGVVWVGNVVAGTSGMTVATQYGGSSFSFVSGLTVDNLNPASEVLFVGDDPSNGFSPGSGRWWTVSHAPGPLAIPGVPTNVKAVAGSASATVSWSPAQDGQPVTSYVVHASFVSNGTTVPDVTVTAPAGSTIVPTSVTVNGLTNGVSYAFEVKACNSAGCSAFSAPSNTVTPHAITVPGAPTNVSATAADSAADVVWTDPSDNGSAIISYTVTARINGVATGTPTTVNGPTATGAHVAGLTNGTAYTFTVHATNSIGVGPESAPSRPVTPNIQGSPDMSLLMTSPATANQGAFVTFTLTVKNTGTAPAANVIVTDSLPSNGTFESSSSSQGICSVSGLTLTCTLGAMNGGTTATINVVDAIGTTSITNSASVVMKDANGAILTDPTPGDEQASSTTAINVPQTTTDIQVNGSAQNGGPAVGSADTYTWQIHNSGNQAANSVSFNLPLPTSLGFQTVSSTLGGTCQGPAPGTAGADIVCNVASIGVGQTQIVTVNVTVLQAGSISATGTGSFSGTDTNNANNSFTVVINAK
jgi:uncharacterized repeat protein (TIGR01451 family)